MECSKLVIALYLVSGSGVYCMYYYIWELKYTAGVWILMVCVYFTNTLTHDWSCFFWKILLDEIASEIFICCE